MPGSLSKRWEKRTRIIFSILIRRSSFTFGKLSLILLVFVLLAPASKRKLPQKETSSPPRNTTSIARSRYSQRPSEYIRKLGTTQAFKPPCRMISSSIRGVAAATQIAARSSSKLATVSVPAGNLPHLNPAQVQLQSKELPSEGPHTHSAADLHQLLKEVSLLLVLVLVLFF
jgi:hypothetical protein